MGKIYTSMGLMSGTSLDGVDVSIIKSDGNTEISSILDGYFEYDKELITKILNIKLRMKMKLTNILSILHGQFKSIRSNTMREITF